MKAKSIVDIIVPVYGGFDHLQRLTPALSDTLTDFGNEVQVYFVNDCTPVEKGAAEIFDHLSKEVEGRDNWHFLSTPENSGFARTNNYGASRGNGQFICMLNSDTVPHPKWLKHMVATLEEYPQVGGVGAKLLFPAWSKDATRPPNTIQHAGVAFNPARMPYHIFLGWPSDAKQVNRHLMTRHLAEITLETAIVQLLQASQRQPQEMAIPMMNLSGGM
jgi:GT2 family glycosyltransferase